MDYASQAPVEHALRKRIIAAVDAGFDHQIIQLRDLVRIPSQCGEEGLAQDFMAGQYRARGYAVDRWQIDIDAIRNLPGFSPVTGSYHNAVNAIEKAIVRIDALNELETRWNARKYEYKHFCGYPHPIRFNLGKSARCDWPASVPAWCYVDMRVAVYPGQSLASGREEICQFIQGMALRYPFLAAHQPKVVFHGLLAEGYVLENADAVETVLRNSHEEVFKAPLKEYVTSAATDARFFGLYANTPAIVYGPKCRMPYGNDEAINLESLRMATQTMALFVAGWCGVEDIA